MTGAFLTLFTVAVISVGAQTKTTKKAKGAVSSGAKSAQSTVVAPQAEPAQPSTSTDQAAAPAATSTEPSASASAAPSQPASSAPTTSTASASAPSAIAETVAAPSDSHVVGNVTLRPSLAIEGADYFVSDNEVMLGYQFHPQSTLSYTQHIHSSSVTGSDGVRSHDGFLKYKYASLWSNNSGTSLTHQPRIYLPTASSKRDAGMITAVRNYLILTQKFTESMSVSLYEVPILHVYSRAAATGVKANPVAENRVYLGFNANLTNALSFEFLIMEFSTRTASVSGAANSAAWTHLVAAYSEIMYSLSPRVAVGAAYESANNGTSLMTPGLGGFQISDGLKDGVISAVLSVSL